MSQKSTSTADDDQETRALQLRTERFSRRRRPHEDEDYTIRELRRGLYRTCAGGFTLIEIVNELEGDQSSEPFFSADRFEILDSTVANLGPQRGRDSFPSGMAGRSAQMTCRHGWPATSSGATVCDLTPNAATEDDDMLRRDLFTGGLAALAVTTTGRLAGAQEKYPSRTVRLIVPTAAGGVYDLMGRLFIDRVAASLGTAIVENRAGGNAVVGVMAAALSAPDGYTLLLGSNSTHIFQPAMMRNPPYDPVKQFEVISTLSASWACIAVSPKLGVNTLGELIDYATKHPIAHGMRGIGDVSHMTAELLKQLVPGFAPQYIPYSQMAQAVRDLMTGDLAMTMPLVTRTLAELHTTGKIKLLAVTSPERLDVVPDVPTAIEAGVPNMVAAEFFYLFSPAGTPQQVLQHLNNTARAALTDDEFKKKLKNAGFDPQFTGNLEATHQMFESERARWLPVAEASGAKIN